MMQGVIPGVTDQDHRADLEAQEFLERYDSVRATMQPFIRARYGPDHADTWKHLFRLHVLACDLHWAAARVTAQADA